MMANIFLIYGVGGHPDENWFPWLRQELESLGHNVITPLFPTPEGQTLENWMRVLEAFKEKIDKDTIFVGHSLGVSFTLNVLERYPAKAAFLVAGFTGKAGNQFDEGMKTFAQREFDWKQIKENCQNFSVFHSDNDPYIVLKKGQELAKNLDSELILVKGAGHINASAGYKSFDLLLFHLASLLHKA